MQILEDLGEAIKPEGVSAVDVVAAIALVAVAFPAARLVERLIRAAIRRVGGLPHDATAVIGSSSRYLTLFIITSLALNLVGVNIGWALALAVLALFIVVMTLRPLVENAAAGFLLKSRPSFAVGDEVQLSGHVGEVLSISARTTVLRTRDGKRVHIRNLDVLDNEIVVFSAFMARRLSVPLTVDQRWDIDVVSDVLDAAVESVPLVLSEPPPRVIVSSLQGGVVELLVQVWFEPQAHSDADVTNAIARTVHPALRREAIELVPPRIRVEPAEELDRPTAMRQATAPDHS